MKTRSCTGNKFNSSHHEVPQDLHVHIHYQFHPISGVFRISKRGAKFSLATSAYTKGAKTMFSNFFSYDKNFFFFQRALPKYATALVHPIFVGFLQCSFYIVILYQSTSSLLTNCGRSAKNEEWKNCHLVAMIKCIH